MYHTCCNMEKKIRNLLLTCCEAIKWEKKKIFKNYIGFLFLHSKINLDFEKLDDQALIVYFTYKVSFICE